MIPDPLSKPSASSSGFGGKIVRYGLVSVGATLIISAVVNVYATFQLLEPSDAESLGVTRNEVLGTYAVFFSLGALLIWFGLRRKKPPADKTKK